MVRLRNIPGPGDADIFVKLEFLSPGGSIKDRIGVGMIARAERAGLLKKGGTIIEPTNASRVALKKLFADNGLQHIIGKGYYAFMHVGDYIKTRGWADTELLGQYLAENHGVAVVPGAFFSPFGGEWIRFSYATPVERTEGAFGRLMEGLSSLRS